jgi:hypothetical protein
MEGGGRFYRLSSTFFFTHCRWGSSFFLPCKWWGTWQCKFVNLVLTPYLWRVKWNTCVKYYFSLGADTVLMTCQMGHLCLTWFFFLSWTATSFSIIVLFYGKFCILAFISHSGRRTSVQAMLNGTSVLYDPNLMKTGYHDMPWMGPTVVPEATKDNRTLLQFLSYFKFTKSGS